MNDANARKLITVNVAYWIIAVLVHPVMQVIPTSSGSVPKIFEFFAPLFMIGLAYGSTMVLKQAITAAQQKEP